MEIKNKLAVTRGEGSKIVGERKGRGKQRNMNGGFLDTDNGRGLTMEVGGMGQERGEQWVKW